MDIQAFPKSPQDQVREDQSDVIWLHLPQQPYIKLE